MRVFICACILAAFVLYGEVRCQTSPNSAIILEPADEEVSIPSGGTFTRKCMSEAPVEWIYDSLDEQVASRINVGSALVNDSVYVSSIEVINVSYLDVGYKRCVHSNAANSTLDLTESGAPVNATSVYMYVDDADNLFVAKEDIPVLLSTVTEFSRGLIPCKPTHPSVVITIRRSFSHQYSEELNESMFYDPRQGFVIKRVQALLHSSAFECFASRGSVEREITVVMNFQRSTDSAAVPYVERETERRHIIEGDSFALVCRAAETDGVTIRIHWDVPGSSTGVKTGRIVQLPQTSSYGSLFADDPVEMSLAVRRLQVTGAMKEDTGGFTCTVQDHNRHTNNVSEYIIVHGSHEASIELRPRHQQIIARTGDFITLTAFIDAYPTPNITWLAPDNRPIASYLSRRFSVTIEEESSRLDIRQVSLEDSGIYTVQARAPNGKANESLQFNVTILDKARAIMVTDGKFVEANSSSEIRCAVTGFPLPSVEWTFLACEHNTTCNTALSHLATMDAVNSETISETVVAQYKLDTVLYVSRAVHSGWYTCHAINDHSVPPANASYRLSVTDIEGGFGLRLGESTAVAGQPFQLHCLVSRFLADSADQLSWFSRPLSADQLEDEQWRPVVNSSDMMILNNSTQYSHVKSLDWTGIYTNNSAVYKCQLTQGGDIINRSQRLIVKEPQKPRFLSSANMNASRSVELQQGGTLLLSCLVSGIPPPRVQWFKDDTSLRVSASRDQRVRLLPQSNGQQLYISAALAVDSGSYRCRAANRVGSVHGVMSVLVAADGLSSTVVIVVVVVMLAVFIPLATLLALKIRRQRALQRRLTLRELETFTNGLMQQYNPDLTVDEQAELLPYDEAWEFPRDKLILGRQIGSGTFGRVVRAEAVGLSVGNIDDTEQDFGLNCSNPTSTVVAVKMPRSGADPDQIRSLMAELKIMIQLGRHLNVVNLLGAVTKNALNGEFMVMVEYCRHGNMHNYLLKHKHCFVNQLHPVTGEYDDSLGEDLFNALTAEAADECLDSHYKSPRLSTATAAADTSTTSCSVEADTTVGTTAHLLNDAGESCASVTNGHCTDTASQLSHPTIRFRRTGATSDSACVSGYDGMCGSVTMGRSNKRLTPVTTRDLLCWSYQVASGMQYLASRKLLHGDLAARNILLADDRIVKISDFGLSRDIYKTRDYKKTSKGPLPVKWMAIESIQYSVFSSQSDVWAFGVVLWEMFSLGAAPYPGMEYDVNFVRRLRGGYRMDRPVFSPGRVYQLMQNCWLESPDERPSFDQLTAKLGSLLEDGTVQEFDRLRKPFEELNARYLSNRAVYINQLMTGDYQNVDQTLDTAGFPDISAENEVPQATTTTTSPAVEYVNLDAHNQPAFFATNTPASAKDTGSIQGASLDTSHQDYLVPRSHVPYSEL